MQNLKRIAAIILASGTFTLAATAQDSMGGGQGMMSKSLYERLGGESAQPDDRRKA